MLAGSLMLGGLLPLSHSARDAWAPSGAWRWPVGDPYELVTERPAEPGKFFLLRSVDTDGFKVTHQGVDLGCGASGSFVRAAAAGLVVRAADHGEHGGYGTHVVLAHRLPGGVLAYSAYAHLRTASIRVKAGQFVPAGTRLGRVGMTGRATTPHLHFEIRTSTDPGARWELANVEDPVAFVDERLPSHRSDTSGVAAYLEWAECASLLPTQAKGDDALSREAWWRMLVVTDRGLLCDPALPGEYLRDSLVAAGTLARSAQTALAGQPMEWSELARDLNHIRRSNLRGGKAPFRKAKHRSLLAANIGTPTPTRRISDLSGRPGRPSLSEAVLLLADLAGPAPEPPKRAAPAGTKPAVPRADSLARGGASAPIAAKSTSTKSTTTTSVKRTTARDSAGKAKPSATRSDSLAKASVSKSVSSAKPASARPDTGAKSKATPTRADSLARASAAKAGAAAKPTTSRADTGVRAKATVTRADSLARASAAKAGTAAKPTTSRADTGVKAKATMTRADSLARASAAKAKPKPTRADSLARARAAGESSTVKPKSATTRVDTTAKPKPTRADSLARASAPKSGASAKPRTPTTASDSTAKPKSTTAKSSTAKKSSASPSKSAPARADTTARKATKPAAPAPARADSSRS